MTDMTSRIPVDPGNARTAAEWDGEHGHYWADNADRYDDCYAAYEPLLLSAAAVRPGERVLDVGCGSGQVAIDIVRSVRGASALGVDLSSAQLAVARDRAGDDPAEFLQADAQVHDFDAAFDVVVSRTGTMFFSDQAAAMANLARAARPGGRLVVLVWRGPEANPWMTSMIGALAVGRDLPMPPPGAPGPFSQSDPDVVRPTLEAAGWTDVSFRKADEPTRFGADVGEATDWMLGQFPWLLAPLNDSQRQEAVENLRAVMQASLTPDGIRMDSGAWIITARRG